MLGRISNSRTQVGPSIALLYFMLQRVEQEWTVRMDSLSGPFLSPEPGHKNWTQKQDSWQQTHFKASILVLGMISNSRTQVGPSIF